tara:strand:+ start:322 stop:750 length:429 start_codon:yes stop_codon:yes gene_type:complete
MIKAKTVILENLYKLVFEGKIIEKKEIKRNQLLCETYYTAISTGTETAAYTEKPALSSNINYSRLLGYCNVSKILKIGRGINSLRPVQFILTFSSHCSHSIIIGQKVLFSIIESHLQKNTIVELNSFSNGLTVEAKTNGRFA